MWSITLLSYAGAILLSVLCYNDFKKQVVRQRPLFGYYSAIFLFILVNFTVYIGLLEIIADIEFDKFLFNFKHPNEDSKAFELRYAAPFIIALMYFGAGAYNIEYNEKTISIYGKMLTLFKGMFSLSSQAERKIDECLEMLGEETTKLKIKIDKMHNKAKEWNWKCSEEEWKIISSDLDVIEKSINILRRVESDLEKGHLYRDDIERIIINTK